MLETEKQEVFEGQKREVIATLDGPLLLGSGDVCTLQDHRRMLFNHLYSKHSLHGSV